MTHHKGLGRQGGEEVLAGHAIVGLLQGCACHAPCLLLVMGLFSSMACGPDSQLSEAWKDGLKIIQS